MPTYTVMTGKQPRLLRSHACGPTATTHAVTTVPDARRATAVARDLNTLVTHLPAALHQEAVRAAGQRSSLRRAALSAFDTASGDTDLTRLVAAVGGHLTEAPDAVRRAVRDEVAALLDGYDDILVPAEASSDDHAVAVTFVANRFLAGASDTALTAILTVHGDVSEETDQVIYALDGTDPAVTRLCAYLAGAPTQFAEPVGFTCRVDADALAAWITAHRPHLS